MSHATLHRLWQLLLKGIEEVAVAVMPREAAEMALLRIVHASSLPDPGHAGAQAGERRGDRACRRAAPPPRRRAVRPAAAAGLAAPIFPALVALLDDKGEVAARRGSAIDSSAWFAMRRPSWCSSRSSRLPAISFARIALPQGG